MLSCAHNNEIHLTPPYFHLVKVAQLLTTEYFCEYMKIY